MAQAKENNPASRAKTPAAPKAAAANGTAPAGEKRARPTTRRPYYNRRPRRAQQPKEAATPIHIYPLGGLGEVGKNMTVYECNGDMIIVDCGLVFPDSEMYGVDENYIEMKGYTLAKGRNIQYMDIADNKQICVIGDYINRTAYGGNAVGQTIKLGPYKFRIVGVLKAKISNPDQQEGSDDDSVYLPYTTAMRLSNESSPDSYSAIMVDEGQANEAKAAVEQGLYDIFKSDNAYYVYSASEWLEEMNKMINMVIVILTGIASISLLVGGIGIMNIMLVSVTERTREIGIRKAMGAKEKTILAQFVTEAATTSALGGTLGIVLGYIVSAIANQVLPMFTDGMDITVSPSFNSIAAAFGISVFIGVLFGYLPAKRAARLNPIDALRYD